ncbi:MAG: NAD(P)H-hydrate epimerase [Calothrix sp. MO_167.B42]|nr:NAD(P)H-hydrate epimerase [Calothrix sp. MO_167.B42]
MTKNFFTDTGIQVPSVTTEQMIEVDRVAMEETGPNLFQMMENAGRNLALQAIDCLGKEWQKANIMILAGSGGNGGGGICGARHLANRGAKVTLCLSSPDRLTEVPKWQYHIYQNTDGKEVAIGDLIASDEPVDFIIDALIGYSLRAAPRGNALELIKWANNTGAPILSLDIPSGVDSTTGETIGEYIHASWTMTLALPKTGLLIDKTGELILADIGIPAGIYAWEILQLSYIPPFGDRFRVPLVCKG